MGSCRLATHCRPCQGWIVRWPVVQGLVPPGYLLPPVPGLEAITDLPDKPLVPELGSAEVDVGVGPPLNCSGPSRGSTPLWSPACVKPQVPSLSRLWPREVIGFPE